VYYYNGAQRYEQFLQVGWLYRALMLLGLAVCLPSASVSLVLMVLYRYKKIFWFHPSLHLLVSWAWWDWPLTWLTNHRPSVLWHCWLGHHVTRKTVSEMTYNVSSGTLNSTIPSKVDQVNSMGHTVYKNYWNLVKLCPGNLVRFLDTLILQMWLCGGGHHWVQAAFSSQFC